ASGPQAKDPCPHNQLDTSNQPKQAPSQCQGFNRLRFDHTPQELSGPLMSDFFRLEIQGPREKSLPEQSACANGQNTFQPGREHPERYQCEKEENPGEEPT